MGPLDDASYDSMYAEQYFHELHGYPKADLCKGCKEWRNLINTKCVFCQRTKTMINYLDCIKYINAKLLEPYTKEQENE